MELCKDKKFVCKFCSKRFPCGKSLGGHIRTHMNNDYSVDSDDDEHDKLNTDENGGQSSYGLRENPKKNKRFMDQRVMMALKHQQQHLCCKECGKGFVSSKALCGHMACHYEREKIAMDSQSDTEASSSPIRTRSKRIIKHHHIPGFVVCGGGGGSSSIMNQTDSASSNAYGIEPEQEEMALSLMMLSRDSSFKKGYNLVVNSLAESSEKNSVILETKSSSGEQLKIFNVEEKNKLGGMEEKQLRSSEDNIDVPYDSDNSDSGYFMNGPKKLDSNVSVDGFLRDKAVMRSGSRFNSSTTKHDKNLNIFRKEWSRSGSGSGSEPGRSSAKYDLRKRKRDIPCYGRRKIKYEFTESVYESGVHSLESDSCTDTNPTRIKIHSNKSTVAKKASDGKKKSKGHECPICFRVFKSGQALGGHKRSHFIGNQEHKTLVIQQHHVAHHEMHTLLDLNLPAPIDE